MRAAIDVQDVTSVKENGSLDRWVGALELPRGQATDMQIVPIEAGLHTVTVELDLHFDLLQRHPLAA
jgi:hypothetical protein